MADLWETLTIGFVLSLLFIGVSYLFWRRYDRPTPLMVERAEEKARLREEQRTWREIEAKVRAEMAEAEEKAWLDRQRAEKAARAEAPATTTMTSAWASLGMGESVASSPSADSTTEGASEDAPRRKDFLADGDNLNATHRAQSGLGEVDVEDDDDLHAAPDLVQVRRDPGVIEGPEAPDWELVAKLEALASKDEVEVPDVPEAPDLDQLVATDELTSSEDHRTVLAAEAETSERSDDGSEVETGDERSVASSEDPGSPEDTELAEPATKSDGAFVEGTMAVDASPDAIAPEAAPARDTPTEPIAPGEAADEGEAWGEDSGGDPWSGATW